MRPDFVRMIRELEAAGVSRWKIATVCGVQLTQVNRWANGSEPKYWPGSILVSLHDQAVLCRPRATSVTVTPVTVSPATEPSQG